MLPTTLGVPPENNAETGATRERLPRWVLALQLLGACAWLGLVTWKLDLVPGLVMDEAWSIISARGQWPPANPLSGMSAYTGAFPVLLLRLFGTSHGLLVLRGAAVVAHAGLLVSVGLLLQRQLGRRALAGWAMPLIATTPAWLLSVRVGMEVTMFTAPLAVFGLYCMTRGRGWWAFAAGLSWGFSVYNHLLGLWAVLAIVTAWLVTYRRWPSRAWWPALVGFGLGVAPRALAVVLYDNAQIRDTAAALSWRAALADLIWLPSTYWQFLLGRPAYLRYVGRIAEEIRPYWALAPLLLLPWLRRVRDVPRAAWFVLLLLLFSCIFATFGAPYFEVRYFVLPIIALPVALVLLGAAAIERDRRWAILVRAVAAALVAGNLYYLFVDFYRPWQRRELGVNVQRLGTRSPPVGSWHFLPKDELVRELLRIDPPPEQVIGPGSITRPLEALLDGTNIRAITRGKPNPKLRSVYVDYRSAGMRPRQCVPARRGKLCFVQPRIVDSHYVIYRQQ